MYTEVISKFTHNEKEYSVWKKVETTPQRISYGIFDSTDTLVFRCEMSFISKMKYLEPNYQSFYTDLDALVAKDLERHFIQTSHKDDLLSQIETNNKRQFQQIKLAKFDAKVEKDRLKKENVKKN